MGGLTEKAKRTGQLNRIFGKPVKSELQKPRKRCRVCNRYLRVSEYITCNRCYYGMRLDPKGWKREMRKEGVRVEYQGGCVPFQDGKFKGILCRAPFRRAA